MDDRAVEGPPQELGLQNERTTLAWRRTNLALLATSALAAKAASSTVVGLAVLTAALALAGTGGWLIDRRHQVRHDEVGPGCVTPEGAPPPELAAPRAAAGVTAVVLALGAASLALILI
jgi:putative membrane protein